MEVGLAFWQSKTLLSATILKDSSLTGVNAYFQLIWIEPENFKCTQATFGLIASKALAITILQ